MPPTITPEQASAIAEYVNTHDLSEGVGTEESACSIAAINLGLNGQLTDTIPECMSRVIGRWIINVQDAMPADMRNSPEWKQLLPIAAGTGRALEKQRADVALDWMWPVLALMQDVADDGGFGDEWRKMCEDKTQAAARVAARVAARAAAYAAADAADAAYAADAACAAAYAAAIARADFWTKANPAACLAARSM